jgi:TPR repeat protein
MGRGFAFFLAAVLCVRASGDALNDRLTTQREAEQGDAGAQYRLARLYHDEGSYTKAFEWARKAGDQGSAEAQVYLGELFDKGEGVVLHSHEAAAEWWLKAAEQGVKLAQREMGFKFLNGSGVKQSYTLAIEWLQKSSDQGDDLSDMLLAAAKQGQLMQEQHAREEL